jgi:hypothetical protein
MNGSMWSMWLGWIYVDPYVHTIVDTIVDCFTHATKIANFEIGNGQPKER